MKTLLLSLILVLAISRVKSSNSFTLSRAAVETDDFQTLILNNDLYVDKSLLIEEFLEDMKNNTKLRPDLVEDLKPAEIDFVPYVIRPDGWGKSTNLDMLRKFFEIEVDDKGGRLPKENCTSDKLFLGGDFPAGPKQVKKLKPLKIANCSDALEHMGKYPVILVKMKDAVGNSFEEIENNIKLCIAREFKRHRYLLHSEYITDEDKENLTRYMNGTFDGEELQRSVLFLSEKLHHHYGERAQIFFDDIEVPAIHAHLSLSAVFELHNKLLVLIKLIYGLAYKVNRHRHHGIMTGVLIPVKPPVPSVDLHIPVSAVLEKRPLFLPYYGFTDQEVHQLLTKVPIRLDQDELRSWYGNYCVYMNEPETFYNSRSVMRCLANNGTLKYYGSQSSVTTFIDDLLQDDEMQLLIQNILQGGSIMNYFFSYADFWPTFWAGVLDSRSRTLYLAGYLKAHFQTGKPPLLVLPNEETRHLIGTTVVHWVRGKFYLRPHQFHSFVGLLLQSKIDLFRNELKKYISTINNFYSTSARKEAIQKSIYFAINVAIKTVLSETHSVASPTQLGMDATNETILIPYQDRSDVAFIIDYDVVPKERGLISTAAPELSQISISRFSQRLKTYSHVRKIIKISMTFQADNVELEYGIEIA